MAYLIANPYALVLVDSGAPGSEYAILKTIQQLGRDDLRLIFITHAHLDHYGSAAALRRLTGAPIAIHTADAQAMANADTILGVARKRGKLVRLFFPLLEKLLKPEPTTADQQLHDGEQLAIPGIKTNVLHTPGHTPGHCCLIVDDRFAFAGDLLSSTGKPHIQPYYAQDWKQLSSSLARLKAITPEITYPAHGDRPILNSQLQSL